MATPHDLFFRHTFSQPEHAQSMLRALLPADLQASLDLSRLALASGALVDDVLTERRSDLVFTAPLRGCPGAGAREAYLYCLIEHQSRPDPTLPLRMLGYVTRLWRRHHREHGLPLPPVLPCLLAQTERPWSTPLDLWSLVDFGGAPKPGLRAATPQFQITVYDLAERSEAEIRGACGPNPLATLALLLLKWARAGLTLRAALLKAVDLLQRLLRWPDGRRALTAALSYSVEAMNEPDLAALAPVLAAQGDHELEESLMSLAEQLREEGRLKGMQQGMQQGMQAGRLQARRDTLHRLLQLRFAGAYDAAARARVDAADEAALAQWTDRVLTAPTPAEVFAD